MILITVYVVIAEVSVAVDLARIIHQERQKENEEEGQSPERVIISIDKDQYSTIGGLQKHCVKHFEQISNIPDLDSFDEACSSLFVLTPSRTSKNETFTSIVANFSYQEPFLVPHVPKDLQWEVPDYAANAYDAVQVLADGLTRAYKKSSTGRVNGTAVMSEILGLRYRSIFGFDQQIDENGDADGNFTLLSFTKDIGLRPAAHFISQECSEVSPVCLPFIPKIQFIAGHSIKWLPNEIPPDEPECGFNNEYCEQNINWTQMLLITCCFSLLSIALGFIVK